MHLSLSIDISTYIYIYVYYIEQDIILLLVKSKFICSHIYLFLAHSVPTDQGRMTFNSAYAVHHPTHILQIQQISRAHIEQMFIALNPLSFV